MRNCIVPIIALAVLSVGIAATASSLFEPSNEYLRTTTSPPAIREMTVSLWFRVANTTARHTLLIIEQSGTNQRIVLYADGPDTNDLADRVWYLAQTSDGSIASTGYTTNSFQADTWHHLLFTAKDQYAYGAYDIKLDGGTSTSPDGDDNPPEYTNYSVQIGGDNRQVTQIVGDYDYLPSPSGEIAEVGIWPAVLSAADMNALTSRFSPVFVRLRALAFYAPLVRGLQELLNGCTLTAYNSPGTGEHPPIRR